MRGLRRCVPLVLVLLLTAAALGAQEPTNEFRPVSPDELGQDGPAAGPLVLAAYAFVWGALLVYVFSLWQRMKRVDADLKAVSAKLGGRRG